MPAILLQNKDSINNLYDVTEELASLNTEKEDILQCPVYLVT